MIQELEFKYPIWVSESDGWPKSEHIPEILKRFKIPKMLEGYVHKSTSSFDMRKGFVQLKLMKSDCFHWTIKQNINGPDEYHIEVYYVAFINGEKVSLPIGCTLENWIDGKVCRGLELSGIF